MSSQMSLQAFVARSAALALAALPIISNSGSTASATELKTLYAFCAQTNCTDGDVPTGMIMDQSGTFYGTTVIGGDAGQGTVFELVAGKRKWNFKRLYSFCARDGCSDGTYPNASLIVDTSGNLYGTASGGGAGGGIVFELEPGKSRKSWNYKVIYTFCVGHGTCPDGSQPYSAGLTYSGAAAGLPYDGVSALFGTTASGGKGTSGGFGTAFTLTPAAHGKWKHKVIYNFCVDSERPNCQDGGPSYTMAMDAGGALYDTAAGGENSSGVVFRLTQISHRWKQSLLHTFGPYDSDDGNDQNGSSVIVDGSGRLIGTTPYGGGNNIDFYQAGGGTLFAIGGSYQILHSFCAQPNCADGEYPGGVPAEDSSGAIFGTTTIGGNAYEDSGGGVLYRLGADGSYAVLYDFCSLANCADGVNPAGGVILAPSGKIYGVTNNGGANATDAVAGGTVFELTP